LKNSLITIEVNSHLTLRQYSLADAPALFRLVNQNRSHLRSRLTWVDTCLSVADSEAYIVATTRVTDTNGAPTFGIWYDNQLIGTVSFHPIRHDIKTTMLGYWIEASMQGRGIVSAATQALITYGFENLGLKHIEIVCAPDNHSSQAITLKLGFIRQAETQVAVWSHDPSAEMVVFSLSAL
jgi:ribosomal-protein-serine acetyltransferase